MQACLRTLSKAHHCSLGANANNGGLGSLMLDQVANSALKKDHRDNIWCCLNSLNVLIILYNNGVVAIQACPTTLSKAHHYYPGVNANNGGHGM